MAETNLTIFIKMITKYLSLHFIVKRCLLFYEAVGLCYHLLRL